MSRGLVILGAGGHGKVIADIALKMNKWKEIFFLDNNLEDNSTMGIEIKGKTDAVSSYINKHDIFVGIGNNYVRKKIQLELEKMGASIPKLIHPSSIIGEQVQVECGTAIMAGVVINCSTKIGKGCIINTSATVDHDSLIEDFIHISPGVHLAGTVSVGQNTWFGIGSIVSNNINIIHECIIGAGAVVVNDIAEPGTYVGVPARRVK